MTRQRRLKILKRLHAGAIIVYGLALCYVPLHNWEELAGGLIEHNFVEFAALANGIIQVVYGVITWIQASRGLIESQ